jgi:hypothetical protein
MHVVLGSLSSRRCDPQHKMPICAFAWASRVLSESSMPTHASGTPLPRRMHQTVGTGAFSPPLRPTRVRTERGNTAAADAPPGCWERHPPVGSALPRSPFSGFLGAFVRDTKPSYRARLGNALSLGIHESCSNTCLPRPFPLVPRAYL